MRRAAVFAHYDKDRIIDDYVIYYLKSLKEIFDNYKFNQNTFEFNKWFSKIFNISIEEKEKHK